MTQLHIIQPKRPKSPRHIQLQPVTADPLLQRNPSSATKYFSIAAATTTLDYRSLSLVNILLANPSFYSTRAFIKCSDSPLLVC